jgi:hypothetical protein
MGALKGITACTGAAAALVVLTACASAPRAEYRAGLFLHRNPTYSFRVPDGWRQALASDVEGFGYTKLAFRLAKEERKTGMRRKLVEGMKKVDAVLISSGGAAILGWSTANREGFRLPRTHSLSEEEQATLVSSLKEGIEKTVKPDEFVIESVQLVEYGPNQVVSVRARALAMMTLRIITFIGESFVHVVHVGTPGDDDEGLQGFEALAQSFRFE